MVVKDCGYEWKALNGELRFTLYLIRSKELVNIFELLSE